MSQTVSLATEPRTGTGSRAAQKLRKQGLLPAVIYGHKEETVAVTVNAKELHRAIVTLHARVLDLSVGGKTETVLIRELQWDHLGSEMMHVDFARISKDEKVKVTVPVKLKNAPKSMGGGVLDQPFHQLHIECLATAIPDDITIDITNLTLGQPIHVKELTLPEGVKVLESQEVVVVQLKLPGAEAAAPTPIDGTATGPEVIKPEKKKGDEEDEEKKK
ncbi:50S ribosomal protein L25 [Limnoglobus roseus]|uniref:Large ribosomal subunit protein bL25 n=1 Tax=Limnoglobus roseus TaxID=2598579 RepID=A0A5C1AAL9_9BACT|nr:50S ribosomal protein L25 [Limnoglobus roseus]QEL15267.1 50S ribosomal protein L25 [Limnoglobus roseus]